MPVQRVSCDECGKGNNACPECGEHFVTPLDNPEKKKPTTLARYGPYGEETYSHVCWNCGWQEEIRVTIEAIEE